MWGTQTVRCLTHEEIAEIPGDRTITYARIVVDYRKQKSDPNIVRITVGGNLLKADQELTVKMSDLATLKVMWNSTIRTKGSRFMCSDISGFYLEIPLPKFEYTKMSIRDIPQAFRDLYGLNAMAKNGFVYMCIQKGMYGLPAAGILANKLLKSRLAKKGYFELPHTPGLWKHISRPISFTLVVDGLASNMWGRSTLTISCWRSLITIRLRTIGKENCTAALNFDGITTGGG